MAKRRGKAEAEAQAEVDQAFAVVPEDDEPLEQRRRMLRKAEVGYYMALFPGIEPAEVCERFGIARTTLATWKQDDVFRAGFEKGAALRVTEQDDAARSFFRSRVMTYVERLDAIATQTEDKRTALQALIRILESQGTLEQQKASIVNVAISLQRSLEGTAGVAPVVIVEGREVKQHGEKQGQGREEGRAVAPGGGNEGSAGE